MHRVNDYIETNGASLTVDVNDESLTGEEAKQNIKDLITKMELEDKGVILSHSASRARITVRVKGESKNIDNFQNAILENGQYCITRRVSLAY